MSFCNYCGHEVRDGDRFCCSCGRAITAASDKVQDIIYKCPNCGEPLPGFAVRCSSCGMELRDISKKSEVTIFLEKLNTLGDGIYGAERKARSIRDFTVPDTRDETMEFLAHAVTCIDTRLVSKANPTKAEMKRSEYNAQSMLTEAWIEKFEEVYKRAETEYGDDPAFQQFRMISEQKHRDLKKARRAKKRENSVLRNGCIIFLAAVTILGLLIFLLALFIWAYI